MTTTTKDIILTIRKCSLEQLGALRTFTLYDPPIVTTKTVSDSINSVDQQSLGGIISSLCRIKTEQGTLIEPVGRDKDEGLRWKLNEALISKIELEALLDEIMGKGLKWAEVPEKTKK